jgi:PHD/YefM family antitoxin component YafN of YafNO toxin-antitoxin module
MSGITFMVNSRGEKTAVVIDLRRYRKLREDFYDTALVESRAKEPRETLNAVKRRLKLTKAHG